MSVTAIQDEILGLPVTERARLIDVLWGSFAKPEQQAREAAGAIFSAGLITVVAKNTPLPHASVSSRPVLPSSQ
jgi:hypothetical protein